MQDTSSVTVGLDHVVTAVRRAKKKSLKVTLLIGAGCSATAGIPLASGFVDRIRKDFREEYVAINGEKTYPACMHAIGPADSRDLVNEAIATSTINAAHVAIAQLLSFGFVDRILTTNFDSLVNRACSLLNVFPAVYDLPLSKPIRAHDLARIENDIGIFHLHGQHQGFLLLHSDEETHAHKKRVKPLVEYKVREHVWIVVGYSGENDPVIELLASIPSFDRNLYWVQYRHHAPSDFIRNSLLKPEKRASLVPGFDADRFFAALAIKLGCFPPDYLRKPFSFLKQTLSSISDFPEWCLPDEPPREMTTTKWAERNLFVAPEDKVASTYEPIALVEKAINKSIADHESNEETLALDASFRYLGGDVEEALRLWEKCDPVQVGGINAYSEHLARIHMGCARVHLLNAKECSSDQNRALVALRRARRHVKKGLKSWPHLDVLHLVAALVEEENFYLTKLKRRRRELIDSVIDCNECYSNADASNPDRRISSAIILLQMAEASEEMEEESCLREKASDCLIQAYKLGDSIAVIGLLANNFLKLARRQSGDSKTKSLRDAVYYGSMAAKDKTSPAVYDLACTYAVLGDLKGAKKWLTMAASGGFANKQAMIVDEDLDTLRQEQWFIDLLSSM